MLYSRTHVATVGIKGLELSITFLNPIKSNPWMNRIHIQLRYAHVFMLMTLDRIMVEEKLTAPTVDFVIAVICDYRWFM